jgi:hypothetical protein
MEPKTWRRNTLPGPKPIPKGQPKWVYSVGILVTFKHERFMHNTCLGLEATYQNFSSSKPCKGRPFEHCKIIADIHYYVIGTE